MNLEGRTWVTNKTNGNFVNAKQVLNGCEKCDSLIIWSFLGQIITKVCAKVIEQGKGAEIV